MGIENWRQESGPDIGKWIAAIAELEAISSMASFSFEHPDAVFPDLAEDGLHFEATGTAPSSDESTPRCTERCAPGRRRAAADYQRIEHVGQEHAAAGRGRERRAGVGGRARDAPRGSASRRSPSGASMRTGDSLHDHRRASTPRSAG